MERLFRPLRRRVEKCGTFAENEVPDVENSQIGHALPKVLDREDRFRYTTVTLTP